MAIGGCTVAELQTRMAHAEFVDWLAFATTEPLPAQRGDIQVAMLMHLLVQINRTKRTKKIKITDFMPDWWQDKRRPEHLAAKFRALTAHIEAEAEPESPQAANSRQAAAEKTRGENGRRT